MTPVIDKFEVHHCRPQYFILMGYRVTVPLYNALRPKDLFSFFSSRFSLATVFSFHARYTTGRFCTYRELIKIAKQSAQIAKHGDGFSEIHKIRHVGACLNIDQCFEI